MSADHDQKAENVWRSFLIEGSVAQERRQRYIFKMLPGNPRCKWCYAPFTGLGGTVTRMFYGKRPSNMNPRMCNMCEQFASKHQGGAEVELTLLFADVRGSTTIAETMEPMAYSRLINRFYNAATHVMTNTNALIDKIIGDQVAGMYVRGMVGEAHAASAVAAAEELLSATGHAESQGPWVPLGIGVHTGVAFVGSVGSKDGTIDITVLGDAANTTARLSSQAGVGEILVSEAAAQAAAQAAGLDLTKYEKRDLALKGKSEPVGVYVLKGERFS